MQHDQAIIARLQTDPRRLISADHTSDCHTLVYEILATIPSGYLQSYSGLLPQKCRHSSRYRCHPVHPLSWLGDVRQHAPLTQSLPVKVRSKPSASKMWFMRVACLQLDPLDCELIFRRSEPAQHACGQAGACTNCFGASQNRRSSLGFKFVHLNI